MNRVALVTGGTRGIGEATSVQLKNAGYSVIAVYHHDDTAAKEFETETGISTYKLDVSNYNASKEVIASIVKDHGPIDTLVNNAGITKDAVLHKMEYEQWYDVIQTNLTSCFNMCRHVIGSMRDRGFGRIINVSSINGQKGQFGQTNYSAAKAGILGFTKALAQESAIKGITVNAIAPGYIQTDMVKDVPEQILTRIINQIPAGRLGLPEEVARAVVFLASEDAGFITGSTLTINGGQYLV